jgi:hypothetical protein
VQRQILQTEPTADLRVYAIWVPFLAGSEDTANIAQRVISDRRVTQYWDGSALTSDWFAENVDHSPFPSWDAYYLYGPDAMWTRAPGPLVESGSTIIGESSTLEHAVASLIASASRSSA